MTELVTAVAIPVLAWFVAGTIWNVRSGRRVMTWMQGGLRLLGDRTTVRWLGSSAVEMVIQKARAPFEKVTLILFLEARDVPWMWALGRARGRRDILIVRGHLARAPAVDLVALDPQSWSGRDALPSIARGEWSHRPPTGPGALELHTKTPAAIGRAEALLAQARESGFSVTRLSVRRGEPHFTIHLPLPDGKAEAGAYFEAVRALAAKAAG